MSYDLLLLLLCLAWCAVSRVLLRHLFLTSIVSPCFTYMSSACTHVKNKDSFRWHPDSVGASFFRQKHVHFLNHDSNSTDVSLQSRQKDMEQPLSFANRTFIVTKYSSVYIILRHQVTSHWCLTRWDLLPHVRAHAVNRPRCVHHYSYDEKIWKSFSWWNPSKEETCSREEKKTSRHPRRSPTGSGTRTGFTQQSSAIIEMLWGWGRLRSTH